MRVLTVALVGCLWLGLLPRPTTARIVHYESIELITAEADVIVRGTISEIGQLRPVRVFDHPYRYKLLVRVAETLKGPEVGEVSVALDWFDPKLESWQKEKTELLFNLRRWPGPHGLCPFVLRASFGHSLIELDGKGPGVVTMDLQALAARADILRAVREGVTAAPEGGEKKRLRFRLDPLEYPAIRANSTNVVHVWVPVDQRLQQLGERWANSKTMQYRILAPTALSPFRSDENIAILKKLLSDDFHRDIMHARDRGTRYYSARLPAYWVLKSWGVQVEEPVSEVPIRSPRDRVSAAGADSAMIDHNRAEGGIHPSGASSSRRSTPTSTTPTEPPLPAGR